MGSMLPNSIGVFVGLTELALTWNPEPGVEKTAPRGELTLKKSGGRLLGAENWSGTPSQLISRRPSSKVPPTPLLAPPRLARNASTAPWMSPGLAPAASCSTGGGAICATPPLRREHQQHSRRHRRHRS